MFHRRPASRRLATWLCLSLLLAGGWIPATAKDTDDDPPPPEIPIEDRNHIEVNGQWYPVFEYPKEAKPIRDPKPRLPRKAKKEARGGLVLLGVLVNEAGFVIDTQVAMSNTEPDLEAAAQKALKRWQFPIKAVDGQPIAYALMVPVRFDATPFFGPQ